MIGDDMETDIQGAQSIGMKGVLVMTGKFRKSDLPHPNIKPDAVVKNLNEAVDNILVASS